MANVSQIERHSMVTRAAVFSAALVAMVFFAAAFSLERIYAPALDAERNAALARAARAEARLVERSLGELVMDARYLAETDAVRLFDGSDADAVAGTFASFAATRPHYLQVRLIDGAQAGRELVRVDRPRTGEAVRVVPPEALQEKGSREYVRRALQRPELPHLSRLELNRERGKIQVPHTPVVRVSLVLRDDNSLSSRVLVINADPLVLLDPGLTQGGQLLVVNDRGDFLLHPDDAFLFATDLGHTLDDHAFFGNSTEDGTVYDVNVGGEGWGFVGATADSPPLVHAEEATYRLFVGESDAVRYAASSGARRSATLGAAVAASIIAMLLAFVVRRMLRPLGAMAATARQLAAEEPHGALPTEAAGEMGVLARALSEMSERVGARSSSLKDEVSLRRRAEEQTRAIVEALPVGVLFFDRQGLARYANPAANRYFGLESAIGMHAESFVPAGMRELHARHRARFLEEATARPMGDGRTFQLEREDGSTFSAELGLVPARWEHEDGALVVVHDVTEAQRRAEADLSAERERTLCRIAAAVAHDTNNALCALQGSTELLQADLATVQQSLERHNIDVVGLTGDILDACDRIARMTEGLVAYTGTAHSVPRHVAVDAWAEAWADADERVRPSITLAARQIRVSVDEAQLGRVLAHLVSNAWDAVAAKGDGHPIDAVSVSIDVGGAAALERYRLVTGTVADDVDYCIVKVRDEGVGMPDGVLRQAADPLFSTKPGRSGLGLAACAGIVRSMGGVVAIETEEGVGTTVAIALPVVSAEGVESAVRGPFAPRASATESDKPIALVVDDERAVRALMVRVLARDGFDVIEASDGDEAVAIAEVRDDLSLVVLDMRMPRMDGLTALEKMWPRMNGLPVILVSGQSDGATTEAVRKYGSSVRFITKPFSAAAFLTLVDAMIGDRPNKDRSLRELKRAKT